MLELVHKFQEAYDNAQRNDKSVILEDIIGQIQSNGGKFMENIEFEENKGSKTTTQSCWQEVTHETAYKKVSHAFRSNRKVQLQHNQQEDPNQPPAMKTTKKQKGGSSKKKTKKNTPNEMDPNQQYNNMATMGMPAMANGAFPFFAPNGMGYMPGFMPGPWVGGGGPEMAHAQQAFWAQQQQAFMMGNTGNVDPSSLPGGASSETAAAEVKDETMNVEEV
jgi:hypothetical protein